MSEWASRSSLRASVITWFCLAALVVLSSTMGLRAMQAPKMSFGDGLDYLAAGYHLRHDLTFTQASTDGPAPPSLGREPGYGAVLAVLMALDPGAGAYRPSCDASEPACDPWRYRSIALLNLGLIELTGVLVFLVAHRLTRRAWAGLGAAAYLLLDVTLMRAHWWDPMSDELALALVAAAMLALASAWKRTGTAAWAIVGLAFSCATLVKAAFLPFCLGAAAISALTILARPDARRPRLKALATAAVVYAAVTGAWVVRNHHVSGMVRLTDNRGGIALSTREVFDHMSPAQYVAAFVFWTPDFGERLARRLFAPETTARFELYAPGGFYDVGQNGYARHVADLMRSDGLDAWSAASAVDHRIIDDILSAPVGYAVGTLPLLYRGAWMDQFGILGLALLGWSLWFAIRSRNGLLLGIAGFGLYNEFFYALVSLNITRYQMTALPAIAVAAGIALVQVARRTRNFTTRCPAPPDRPSEAAA